jgi:IS1 family transposase
MNQLPLDKKIQILHLLVEGNSMRSASRICNVSINTVTKLLVDTGKECEKIHNEMVLNVKTKKVQLNEICSFVCSKEMNVLQGMERKVGDVWTLTALDADSKLIISWYVGNRDAESVNEFIQNVALRLNNKVQLATVHRANFDTVDEVFGENYHFPLLDKIYEFSTGENSNKRSCSPIEYTSTKKVTIYGHPNEKFISTSFIERQNLTMRRFNRLTNVVNKKIVTYCYAIALHFVYYNVTKIHKSMNVTPAMKEGLTKKPMTLEDIAMLSFSEKLKTGKIIKLNQYKL